MMPGFGRMNAAMHFVLAAFFSGGNPRLATQAQLRAHTYDRYAYKGIRPGTGTAAHQRAALKRRNTKRFRAQARS